MQSDAAEQSSACGQPVLEADAFLAAVICCAQLGIRPNGESVGVAVGYVCPPPTACKSSYRACVMRTLIVCCIACCGLLTGSHNAVSHVPSEYRGFRLYSELSIWSSRYLGSAAIDSAGGYIYQ